MLLLDTNAMVYLAEGLPMREAALAEVEAAGRAGALLVSPVSAWEVGLLCAKGRLPLSLEPRLWFETFLARSGVRLAPLTPAAALLAATLPGVLHADPADRLLAATARELDAPLVTRDARLLAYAAAGHMGAVAY